MKQPGLGAFEQLALEMLLLPTRMGRPTQVHQRARVSSEALCVGQALLGTPSRPQVPTPWRIE